MESNLELFDKCINTIASYSAIDRKADRAGIMSNHEACISIIHNYLKANVLDKNRINNLEVVLYDYALNEFKINGTFTDYKHDNKCPDMTVEDYVDTVFIENKYFSVKEADTGNGGYNIWIATLGLVREMLKILKNNI